MPSVSTTTASVGRCRGAATAVRDERLRARATHRRTRRHGCSATNANANANASRVREQDDFMALASAMGRGASTTRASTSRDATDASSTRGFRGDGVNDASSKRVSLRDVLDGASGPPRMFSPMAGRRRDHRADGGRRPLAVYLPGLDGTGFSASSQFDTIARAGFDLVALNIPVSDRSSVFELVDNVTAYLDARIAENDFNGESVNGAGSSDVYLIGESMGGMLALCVAASRPDLIKRLILVNPASSFDKSVWPTLGPALPSFYPSSLAPFARDQSIPVRERKAPRSTTRLEWMAAPDRASATRSCRTNSRD